MECLASYRSGPIDHANKKERDELVRLANQSIRTIAGFPAVGSIAYSDIRLVREDKELVDTLWKYLMEFYNQVVPLQAAFLENATGATRLNHVLCSLNNGIRIFLD